MNLVSIPSKIIIQNPILMVELGNTKGCFAYLGIYLFTLYQGVSHEDNYQTKTWHFAEAAAFFIFLVYAPVGTTEFMREASDQASLQDQHEAQQLEINQLKAQIKLLTEKVGEV